LDDSRIAELEQLISTLETRLDKLQRERDVLAETNNMARSAAAAAARVAEVAIGRLIEVRELADTAVEWLDDAGLEVKLKQLIVQYKHRRSQES
jgi:hypothetical protein